MARRKKPKKIIYLESSETEQEPVLEERTVRPEPGSVEYMTLLHPKRDHAALETPLQAETTEAHEKTAGESQKDEAVVQNKARSPNRLLSILFALICLVVLAAFILIPLEEPKAAVEQKVAIRENCLGVQPQIDWGYPLAELLCQGGVLEEGQQLAELLLTYNVDYKHIIQLLEGIQKKSLPAIRPGSSFHTMYPKGRPNAPYLMAYSPEPSSFVLLNLKGRPQVHFHERQLLHKEEILSDVVIRSTLAEAMYNREFGLMLTREMEGALKWKLDLFHLDPGDRFSLLFAKEDYEGDYAEVGELAAIKYRHKGEENYAIWYADEYVSGYYDREGRPMKTGFLMAPLEYGRISSPYNPRRPDPVSRSGKIIPHLGTDYAAPEGTPIHAVADGIVTHAEFKGGNGNYVKLLHSTEIQTQYLHMKGFAQGIEPGVEVRQGDVIGFVGSTGRSTGPHVCFRYWKNGLQVDHRKEKNMGTLPVLKGSSFERFNVRRDSLLQKLNPL